MNVAEIISLAELNAEEIYEVPNWISFINAGLDDLTPVVKLLKRTTVAVTVTAGQATVDVSADANLKDAHEVLNVYLTPTTPSGSMRQLKRLPMSDNANQGWKLTADDLLIQNVKPVGEVDVTAGTVTVDFYKKLDHVEDGADIPALPSQYHNLLVLYICAKSQQKEEELNDKNDFYAEYMLGKNNMSLDRIWESEPQNRKFIKRARIAAKVGMPQG